MKRIYLAGGCFWGVEHFFSLIEGIKNTEVGYANSIKVNPSYQEVCANLTDASETVLIDYDDKLITLKEILNLFFKIIDPTSIDQQGDDRGHQYRTGIYYLDENDLLVIEEVIQEVSKAYVEEIVVEVLKLSNFYKAEEYHQDYLIKNPNGYCHLSKDFFKLAKAYKKED